MDTVSPDGLWRQSINVTSVNYRTLALRMEKGLPLLVGGGTDLARVR